MHTPRAEYAISLQTLQRLRPKVGLALAPFPFFGFLLSSSGTSMGLVAVPLPAGVAAACALHGGDTPIAGAIGIGGCKPIGAIGPMGTLPMGTLPTGIVGAVGGGIIMGATGCSGVGIAAGVVMGATGATGVGIAVGGVMGGTVGGTGATGGTLCGRTPARHRTCQELTERRRQAWRAVRLLLRILASQQEQRQGQEPHEAHQPQHGSLSHL